MLQRFLCCFFALWLYYKQEVAWGLENDSIFVMTPSGKKEIHYLKSEPAGMKMMGGGGHVLLLHGAAFDANIWVAVGTLSILSNAGYESIAIGMMVNKYLCCMYIFYLPPSITRSLSSRSPRIRTIPCRKERFKDPPRSATDAYPGRLPHQQGDSDRPLDVRQVGPPLPRRAPRSHIQSYPHRSVYSQGLLREAAVDSPIARPAGVGGA